MYYNRYRYYDPDSCAFISQDPLGLAAGTNLYRYAPNVWGWADPLGLCKNDTSKKLAGKGSNRVATEPDQAFFWSGRTDGIGGEKVAGEIAQSRGGTTLEALIEKNDVKMPNWDPKNPSSMKAWENISAEYASGVSGEVRAVVGKNLRPGNVWENVELPRLMQNKSVTKITTIDPKTLVESVIFKRK